MMIIEIISKGLLLKFVEKLRFEVSGLSFQSLIFQQKISPSKSIDFYILTSIELRIFTHIPETLDQIRYLGIFM